MVTEDIKRLMEEITHLTLMVTEDIKETDGRNHSPDSYGYRRYKRN